MFLQRAPWTRWILTQSMSIHWYILIVQKNTFHCHHRTPDKGNQNSAFSGWFPYSIDANSSMTGVSIQHNMHTGQLDTKFWPSMPTPDHGKFPYSTETVVFSPICALRSTCTIATRFKWCPSAPSGIFISLDNVSGPLTFIFFLLKRIVVFAALR